MEDKSPLPYQHTEFSTVFTVSTILPTLAVLPSVLLLNRSSLTRAHKPRGPYIEFRDMYKPGRKFFFFFLLIAPCNLAFYSTVNVGKHQPPQSYSVQFSCSVMSDSLRPHESQHARLPCPSPTPGVHSDSRHSSQ